MATDEALTTLKGMPLTELNLSDCDQISDNASAAFILKHNLVNPSSVLRTREIDVKFDGFSTTS